MAALLAIGFGPTVAGASASGFAQGPPAGPKNPPFFQCPAIGADSTCEFLIDVTSTNPKEPPRILQDVSQSFYDGNDDVTVAIQNDTTAPLSSVHLGVAGSGDFIFSLDGDGLCSESIAPKPEGCPFGPPGNLASPFDYYGPDTLLTEEPGSNGDAGTVAFNTELQPGQYTYFSLEAPPAGTSVVAGEVNDIVSTSLLNTEGEGAGAAIVSPNPVNVTDTATVKGLKAATATGTVEYAVYSDPECTKLVEKGGTKNVTAGGVAEASEPVGSKLANNAIYYWQAKYSGDGTNSPAVSACGSEVMTFGTPLPPPQPTVVTVLAGGGQVGAKITVPTGTAVTDTAAVIAPGGQPVSGRLTYAAYTTPTCTVGSQIVVGGGGLTTGSGPGSNALTLPVGTYYFQAFYSGNGVLNHAVSPCGSEVLTVAVPSPPPPPNSLFTSVGNPQVNTKTGQVVVIGQFPAPGTATANGVVTQGATLARVKRALAEAARRKSKRCRRGFVKKHKKCVNNEPVVYGTSTATIPAPGTYSIVINPTSKVLKALKAGKRLNVVVSTTFQNRAGGAPVTHVQDVLVKLKKPKHHKKH